MRNWIHSTINYNAPIKIMDMLNVFPLESFV